VAVEDVGRIINPLTLHGQAIGAVVQGLGGALLEHFIYDEHGQLLTGSLADYLMPTASDFPCIRGGGARGKTRASQSARRQGGRRGWHHPGRRRHGQRGGGRAGVARGYAPRAATDATAGVGDDQDCRGKFVDGLSACENPSPFGSTGDTAYMAEPAVNAQFPPSRHFASSSLA